MTLVGPHAQAMDVRLLYFEGCPNWQETDRRLQEALVIAGAAGPVQHVTVQTVEDAQRLGFYGSPTVLISGVDPFAGESAAVGLSCRMFQTPEGLRGAPSVAQLVQVLRSSLRR